MKKSDLKQILNIKQLDAVTAKPENVLILAGAGSGKTTVLVNRIAWLINVEKIMPEKIMAVTFTNKGADELENRIEKICGHLSKKILIGTFHNISYRILKKYHTQLGLSSNFRILDDRDQLFLIKKIHENLGLDEEKWPSKKTQWFINNCKSLGERPEKNYNQGQKQSYRLMHRVYSDYENYCRKNNLVDFGELILRSLDLFRHYPEIRKLYQENLDHILIDEFQDTNSVQYEFIKLISHRRNFITAVGDDDQSIYGWRGANIGNTRDFIKEYHKVRVIKLEQNYRSTKEILYSANAVIKCNTDRLGKNLWTQKSGGEKLKLYHALDEKDESYNVIRHILIQRKNGYLYKDMAILYRMSSQSRCLEKILIKNNVPYKIYGGVRFFDRLEIKDALAYAHLITNKSDNAAFLRIVNKPPRGIGKKTIDSLKIIAKKHKISLWQAGKNFIKSGTSTPSKSLASFMELVYFISKEISGMSMCEQLHHILERSGLLKVHGNSKDHVDSSPLDNLKELINAAKQFQNNHVDCSHISSFLSHVSLERGKDSKNMKEDSINLMTIHASKGLEFPIVFMLGMEEGLFPHRESMGNQKQMEEERRLCYVGITRAMHKLYLSYSKSRCISGYNRNQSSSRFIEEIPNIYLDASSYKDNT